MNELEWRSGWSREQITAILLEQAESFRRLERGVLREQLATLEQAATLPNAVIVTGLRRVGKSTLLAQMAENLGRQAFYYLNFEDDRFINFKASDFNHLFQMLVEVFGQRSIFIIDEIQNVVGWEHFVRRFMDQGFKFYISGSNASLLSRELGTHLTGRYVPIELFPFSFKEYLDFKQVALPTLGRMTTLEIAQLNKDLNEYLQLGGIPDALKYPELPLLRNLYEDVLYRDIATRYRIEAVTTLRELALFLLSNPAGNISYNKLKTRFHMGSLNTIKSYIEYLENSWLIFTLNLYDFSVKRQQIAPKKTYCIDTGMVNTVGFQFSPNTGKLLENLVYLALRRTTRDIFYYTSPESYEVDFYLPKRRQVIQVAQHLANPEVRAREMRAIEAATHHLEVESALVLSDANEDPIEINLVPVEIRSIATWLLG